MRQISSTLNNYSDGNDSHPKYPLHTAVAYNDINKVEELLNSGFNINAQTDMKETALTTAARKGRIEIALLLINRGADVNIVDHNENSPLHYAITKFHITGYNRNDGYSDLARALLENGAKSSSINHDPEFFMKAIKTLSERHEDYAEKFLREKFHSEMSKIYDDFDKDINDFLKNPEPKEGLKTVLKNLINCNFKYENPFEAITHLSHLKSWTSKVIETDHTLDAEGWYMNRYPPLKLKNLLMSLKKISSSNFNCENQFGEPKENIMNKIICEIKSQLTTYYTQINQETIGTLPNKRMKDAAFDEETKMIVRNIRKLKKGKEFAIASGFPGHAIYIGFRKDNEDSVSVRIYNLGLGVDKYHKFNPTMRSYPHIISDISLSKFQNIEADGAKYIKGVLESKLGMIEPKSIDPADYMKNIYDIHNYLEGVRVTENIKAIPMKRQLAGNCVLKNNNAAVRHRLKNDYLYKWLKNEEIAYTESIIKKADKVINSREKESEKDILSFKYIIWAHKKTPDPESAIINFNTFFCKRLALKNNRHTRPIDELNDYMTNVDNQSKINSWLDKVPEAKILLQKLVEKKPNRHHLTI